MYLNMGENMGANGEHEKISIGRVLVSVSTPHIYGRLTAFDAEVLRPRSDSPKSIIFFALNWFVPKKKCTPATHSNPIPKLLKFTQLCSICQSMIPFNCKTREKVSQQRILFLHLPLLLHTLLPRVHMADMLLSHLLFTAALSSFMTHSPNIQTTPCSESGSTLV